MEHWVKEELVFFQGEDPEGLKSRFIELCASHNIDLLHPAYGNHSPYEIALHVFKGKRDPESRAMQAAQVWARDIDVIERIRVLRITGNKKIDIAPNKENLVAIGMEMATNTFNEAKDRINALKLVAQIIGVVQKDIEHENTKGSGNNADLIKALAAMLPS